MRMFRPRTSAHAQKRSRAAAKWRSLCLGWREEGSDAAICSKVPNAGGAQQVGQHLWRLRVGRHIRSRRGSCRPRQRWISEAASGWAAGVQAWTISRWRGDDLVFEQFKRWPRWIEKSEYGTGDGVQADSAFTGKDEIPWSWSLRPRELFLWLHRGLSCLPFSSPFTPRTSTTAQSLVIFRSFLLTAIVGCISKGDEAEYRATVGNCVTWCEQNYLQLNAKKTKELVVDLRRAKVPVTPVSIQGVSVDVVEDYKYLGIPN
ncbi:uncharacterized protein LOC134352486 [Mobula hypostoma]|uniref:uncharacterized protein LOC134352486 n=1 Tax=Mobula hypostoma TaxID=723540 RepID=UPI002FC37F42